ncbi:MAG: S-adenosylmethionine decarboxylase [Bryobacter sp.]|jgi:S-adenosylmethionine decarboxylase|nr:S-adenosylmethionine decarboxylase [Bryobacter sp. CoA8 C33]
MTGYEWLVEAYGCDPVLLGHRESLEALFSALVDGMDLHPVQPVCWHQFASPAPPLPGGITGLLLLSESHLTCHTFPEHASICLNLFCCKPRPEYDFKTTLEQRLGAGSVRVRKLERPYCP